MIVNLEDSFKIVFKYLKLARLMHTIHERKNSYQIIVDGPLSLFSHTIKYGTHMSRFLPALILANKWEMQARINIQNKIKLFYLNNESGLYSYYQYENPFDSSVEEAFFINYS